MPNTLRELPRAALIFLVRSYRLLLSPWLGNSCRFEPTCSVYALDALRRHGAVAGTCLGACRIARCQPWCQAGYDPVPESLPRYFFGAARPDARAARPATPNDVPAP